MTKKGSFDSDKKFRQAEDALDNVDEIFSKAENDSCSLRDILFELKRAAFNLNKIKDNFNMDSSTSVELRKRIDQKLESISQFNKQKQNITFSEGEQQKVLDIIDAKIAELKVKINEIRSQIENLNLKKQTKGKNAQRGEKLDRQIQNIEYHRIRLEKMKNYFKSKPLTYGQDELFREVESFFSNYISNQEYLEENNTMDHIYNQFGEEGQDQANGQEETKNADLGKEQNKFEENTVVKAGKGLVEFDMNAVRAVGFKEEKTTISVIKEVQKKTEFNFFSMLESSFANMPRENDMIPTPLTKEKVTNKTLLPKRRMIEQKSFAEMKNDTLFAIFYFQKNTYDQYLAAQELKKRNWRFHTKHLNWFKRLETPKVEEADYEIGNYLFFDFDLEWKELQKEDFKFTYNFLENN